MIFWLISPINDDDDDKDEDNGGYNNDDVHDGDDHQRMQVHVHIRNQWIYTLKSYLRDLITEVPIEALFITRPLLSY